MKCAALNFLHAMFDSIIQFECDVWSKKMHKILIVVLWCCFICWVCNFLRLCFFFSSCPDWVHLEKKQSKINKFRVSCRCTFADQQVAIFDNLMQIACHAGQIAAVFFSLLGKCFGSLFYLSSKPFRSCSFFCTCDYWMSNSRIKFFINIQKNLRWNDGVCLIKACFILFHHEIHITKAIFANLRIL